MAGDWIKVEHITPDKPEVYDIAGSLKLDPDAVFGKLMRFWIWADQQFIAGKPARISDLAVDSMTRKKGFAAAMRAVGWLGDEGSEAEIPNFDRHNGETAKERAMGNRRVARSRAGSRTNETENGDLCNGDGVTSSLQKPLPEKRREEIDSNKQGRHATTVSRATAAGSACLAIRNAGISDTNPSHPRLIALCEAGATPEEFADAAREAKEREKGFAYVLGIVEGRRRDAAANPIVHGPAPPGKAQTLHELRAATAAALGSKSPLREVIDGESQRLETGSD